MRSTTSVRRASVSVPDLGDRVREKKTDEAHHRSGNYNRVVFTEEMRKNYTILCPQMSPIHFELLEPAFQTAGYNLVVPDVDSHTCVDVGLKYVNNDACYPSLIVVGQLMAAVMSGDYDMSRTAILISQTGGGCRASNYIGFIQRALEKAGYPDVPVISINLSGLEKNPGFKLTLPLIQHGLYALEFGDIFMRCVYATRPYRRLPDQRTSCMKMEKEVIAFITQKKMLSTASSRKCAARSSAILTTFRAKTSRNRASALSARFLSSSIRLPTIIWWSFSNPRVQRPLYRI